MQVGRILQGRAETIGTRRSAASRRLDWIRAAICLLSLGAGAAPARPMPQAATPAAKPSDSGSSPAANAPALQTAPDAKSPATPAPPDPAAAMAEHRKQIAKQSAALLKLATELKAEVDQSSPDALSAGVVRKADALEKLAHDVKDKAKHPDGVKDGGGE